jgi:hypothetical protein
VTAPITTNATAPESKSNIVPLAVGLTFGLLTVAIVTLVALYLRRRRRRKSALLDVLASPLPQPPQARVDGRSCWLPESKRPPQPAQTRIEGRSRWLPESKRPPQPAQPAQPSTLESTLPPGVPIATAVSTVPIGTTELERLPSYESHVR